MKATDMAFAAPQSAFLKRKPVLLQRASTCSSRRRGLVWRASLSEPFTPGGGFDSGTGVYFTPSTATEAVRFFGLTDTPPDLLGVLLWSFALYFGWTETVRWGAALQAKLAKLTGSDDLATFVHSVPFLGAGILTDMFIQGTLGTAWVLASGLLSLMWAGVYELGRWRRWQSEEDAAYEKTLMQAFANFAEVSMKRTGQCHFVDISAAFRRATPAYRNKARLTDEQLRQCIRMWAPTSRRSPNGFYKDLSLVEKSESS